MTEFSLKVIADSMKEMKLNYSFVSYNKKISYPYFVGEYTEIEGFSEDGMEESTMMISGFTRGSWLEIEKAKNTIKDYFGIGKEFINTDGSIAVVMYGDSFPIPQEDLELKRIQINLRIKEWRV